MALDRLLLIFVGEIIMDWALIGGSSLFILQIYEILSGINNVLSIFLISIIAFFLISYSYFRMKSGAQSYAEITLLNEGKDKEQKEQKVEDKYDVEIAHNLEEAKELAKNRYEKFDEFNGKHIYRKEKQ